MCAGKIATEFPVMIASDSWRVPSIIASQITMQAMQDATFRSHSPSAVECPSSESMVSICQKLEVLPSTSASSSWLVFCNLATFALLYILLLQGDPTCILCVHGLLSHWVTC
jgi:hypothetical protein